MFWWVLREIGVGDVIFGKRGLLHLFVFFDPMRDLNAMIYRTLKVYYVNCHCYDAQQLSCNA